jgi:hypothetical protein
LKIEANTKIPIITDFIRQKPEKGTNCSKTGTNRLFLGMRSRKIGRASEKIISGRVP